MKKARHAERVAVPLKRENCKIIWNNSQRLQKFTCWQTGLQNYWNGPLTLLFARLVIIHNWMRGGDYNDFVKIGK